MIGFGIGLLPAGGDADRLIRASALLHARFGFKKTLNHSDNQPHLSLLHLPEVRSERAADVERTFDGFSKGWDGTAAALHVTRLSLVAVGWVFLDVVRMPPLMDLHRQAFAAFRGFLAPAATPKDTALYSEGERRNFELYGYRYIGDSYRPHVTLGRLRSITGDDGQPDLSSVRSELNLRSQEVLLAPELALFELGSDGACCRIVTGRKPSP